LRARTRHHLLGHGSSIDELRENQKVRPWDVPEEYSADTFAAYVLMPTLGLRNAFAVRGLKPATATPVELYRIACQLAWLQHAGHPLVVG